LVGLGTALWPLNTSKFLVNAHASLLSCSVATCVRQADQDDAGRHLEFRLRLLDCILQRLACTAHTVRDHDDEDDEASRTYKAALGVSLLKLR
jgi:hypothetical protein